MSVCLIYISRKERREKVVLCLLQQGEIELDKKTRMELVLRKPPLTFCTDQKVSV